MTINKKLRIQMKVYYFAIMLLFLIACKENSTELNEEIIPQSVLYYGFNTYSDSSSIYTMNLDGTNVNQIFRGQKRYPTWYDYPNKIIVVSKEYNFVTYEVKYSLELFDITSDSSDVEILMEDIGNVLYLKYSKMHNAVLFSYRDMSGISRIGYYDLFSNEMKKLPSNLNGAKIPIWSELDNWIYFIAQENSTQDIYRVTKEGLDYQSFIVDDDYNLSTFAINNNSDLLVASRYNENSSFITVYDLNDKSILYNIDMSEYGYALYPSFTSDNNKILFVNGMLNNYLVSRNIHIMNIDGTNKEQLTYQENFVLSRPLNW